MITIKQPVEFEWDDGNQDKSWHKHKVSTQEAEEVFFDGTKKILKDLIHSQDEDRYLLLGSTKENRKLFVVFTLRSDKVRIISARDLNKKEQQLLRKQANE